MIEVGVKTKLPSAVRSYLLAVIVLLCLVISSPLLLFGQTVWLGFFIVALVLFGIPFAVYASIDIAMTSFVVKDDSITTDSGILFRRSKAIAYANVQSVETVSNMLSTLFGVSSINIWTASQNQLDLSTSQLSKKPDQRLYLLTEDAKWLREFIVTHNKGRQ
jgi:uncharacterized membrane protein YdbT with pleckstrin-like domain